MNSPSPPIWLQEFDRSSFFFPQIVLHGNVRDQVHFPDPVSPSEWRLSSIREAVFRYLHKREFQLITSFDLVDGMQFSDEVLGLAPGDEPNSSVPGMSARFQELTRTNPRPARGNGPRGPVCKDPINLTFDHIRTCLENSKVPCAFLIEHFSQCIAGAKGLSLEERIASLRLQKAAQQASTVFPAQRGQEGGGRSLTNLLVLVCDSLGEIPTSFYVDNPWSKCIEVQRPATANRSYFFFRQLSGVGGSCEETPDSAVPAVFSELGDLTDGMSLQELGALAGMLRSLPSQDWSPKSEVDFFKHGHRETEWDRRDLWSRVSEAEAVLSRQVLGQEAAVQAVSDVLRRALLGLSGAQHSSKCKPRGVLFFAGPTGVGKTEMAKAMARLLFNDERRCLRFDMSEFGREHSDQRLLGAPPGYVGFEKGGELTDSIRSNPFQVLLFDEIEKAHHQILDKFLQILEDGRLTNGRGETAYFSESIIIFTSNAGLYHGRHIS